MECRKVPVLKVESTLGRDADVLVLLLNLTLISIEGAFDALDSIGAARLRRQTGWFSELPRIRSGGRSQENGCEFILRDEEERIESV